MRKYCDLGSGYLRIDYFVSLLKQVTMGACSD